MTDLEASLCGSSNGMAAPARHASKPMEPAMNLGLDNMAHLDTEDHLAARAYSPSMSDDDMSQAHAPHREAAPATIYVTKTECGCKATPAMNPKHMSKMHMGHMSQIPVDVPTSSMGAMHAATSPAMMSNGVMVGASSSSVLFGSQMAATPTPSGASAQRFNAFQGAAPALSAAQGGAAALGVAAVMGLMIAL